MSNSNSLISVAMLSTFISKENKDFLDLIKPFILRSLPNMVGEKVYIDELQKKMQEEFGFENLPTNLIIRILERLRKEKEPCILKKDNEYIVMALINTEEFDEAKKEINAAMEEVLTSLTNYYEKNIRKIKKNDIYILLLGFLEYYGYITLKDSKELKKITNSAQNQQNYHIARFILEEKEKESKVYKNFLIIINGFFIYKSLYYLSNNKKKSIESKLKKTKIFLDTKIVINVLGYHLEQDKIAAQELLNLIEESKGKVKVFTHTLDEVAGILTKYARDPNSRLYLTLDYFNKYSYQEIDVIRLRDSLESNLRKFDIEIVDPPSQNVSSEDNLKDKGFIDVVGLKRCIEFAYKEKANRLPNNESIEKDIDSIAAISRLRGNSRPADIESCEAIFVTHNNLLTKCVFSFLKERFSRGEMNFLINEIDLTSILWLRSYDKKSNLPEIKLLENAYSAIQPTKEFIDQFIINVSKLEREKEISEEEALLFRTNTYAPNFLNDLVSRSDNDPNKLSTKSILLAKEKVEQSLLGINFKENEELRRKLREEEERKNNLIKKIEEDCKNEANRWYISLKKIIYIMMIVLCFYSLYEIKVGSGGQNIIILLLSLYSILDINNKALNIIEGFLLRVKRWIFDRKYSKEMKKIVDLL